MGGAILFPCHLLVFLQCGADPQVRSRAPSPGFSTNQEVAEADLGVGLEADLGVGLRTRGPPYEN